MKMYLVMSILAAMTMGMFGYAAQPDKKQLRKERKAVERTELEGKVAEAVKNKDFTIDITRMHPAQGRSVAVSPYFDLRIKGDSVFSALPYFGRAYSMPYGGGEGLRFEAVMTNYKLTPGRKGSIRTEFDLRSRDDSYRYVIDVFPNGSSSIFVMPNNRQNITFTGNVEFKKAKKTE